MVEVVNKNQQVYTAGLAPKASYSRSIALQLRCRAVAAGQDFAITKPLGNRVWLLGAKVYFMPTVVAALIETEFRLSYGTTAANTFRAVRDDWTPLIGEDRLVGQRTNYYGVGGCLEFSMNRLFTNQLLRFGCAMQIIGPAQDFWALVVFEISEG